MGNFLCGKDGVEIPQKKKNMERLVALSFLHSMRRGVWGVQSCLLRLLVVT